MAHVVKSMGPIQGARGGGAQKRLDCGPVVNGELEKFPYVCVNVKDGPSWFNPVDRQLNLTLSEMEEIGGGVI